jgi:hypothetical protein
MMTDRALPAVRPWSSVMPCFVYHPAFCLRHHHSFGSIIALCQIV